jgi:hypothetical protein
MFRFLVASTVVVAMGLTACGDADADDRANAKATVDDTAPATTDAPGDLEAWCLGWTSPPIPDGDLQTVFEAIEARDRAMAAVAPSEIAEPSQIVVDFDRELNEHLESYDWDPEAPFLDNSSKAQTASIELDSYGEDNC